MTHEATCPEISPVDCAEGGDIPAHSHHQSMSMTRLNGLVAVGLGNGFQIKAELPFDRKALAIEYKDANGKPYDPPYAGLHHRNETLAGVGDGRLQLEYFTRAGERWVFGGGLGATVPTGKTEEDPYERAEKSLVHQHMQMGTGTVNPVASLSAIFSGHQWGMVSQAQAKLSLLQNDKTYKPSSGMTLSVGPTYRLTSKWMLLTGVDLLRESQAYWADRPDPMSGRTAIIASAGAVYRFNTTVAMMAQGRVTAAQWSEMDQITQPFVGVLGVTVTPQKR